MYCKHCGKQIKDGAKFCQYCGQVVEKKEEKVQKQPETPMWTGETGTQGIESAAKAWTKELEQPQNPGENLETGSENPTCTPESGPENPAWMPETESAKQTWTSEPEESAWTSEPDVSGEQEQPQKQSARSKKKPLLIVVAVLCVLILGAAAAIGFMNARLGSQFKKMENGIFADNVAECTEQLQEIKNDWKSAGIFGFNDKKDVLGDLKYLADQSMKYASSLQEAKEYADQAEEKLKSHDFAEEEYKEYENTIEELKTAITDRKGADAEKTKKKAEKAYDAWISASDAYIEKRVEEYKNVNLSRAESSDVEAIQNAIDQVSGLLKEENVDFDKVQEIFETADEAFLKYVEPENYLNIYVQQIDVTDYPNVKLYLDVTDNGNNVVDNLDAGMFYVRKQDVNGNYIKQQVKAVNQLNEIEALNIDMLADVSGSMSGTPLSDAQSIMNRFVDSVQFSAGDKVALTSFSNGVYIDQDFTGDAGSLKNAVNNLYTQDMTAFFDALYTCVNKVAARSGAKCVIAFTDGMDNYSSCSAEDVINLAKRYHVPIFVIGIGYEDYSYARNIAQQTGGNYYSAASVSDMSYIYDQIYKQEKELYMLEFEDTSDVSIFKESSIVTGYHTAEYGGETDYTYTPNTLVNVENSSLYKDGPEGVVSAYMVAFADAMTNQSYGYIEPYILSGSALEAEQRKYVTRGISENIDSYEIENVEYADNNNCFVTTRETYFVQKPGEPLSLLTQRCKYSVVKSGNEWKMTGFADKIEVLSRIAY